MTNLLTKAFGTTILAAGLVGCGGAPSEGDIKSAWERQVTKDKASLGAYGAKMPETKVSNKIGCKEDGEKAYLCDVEMEVLQGGVTQKAPVNMRLLKGSDGWAVGNVSRR